MAGHISLLQSMASCFWEPPWEMRCVCRHRGGKREETCQFVWKCWVYSQWNSHLIGTMISKTIGFRGTLFSDTPMSVWFCLDGWVKRQFCWFTTHGSCFSLYLAVTTRGIAQANKHVSAYIGYLSSVTWFPGKNTMSKKSSCAVTARTALTARTAGSLWKTPGGWAGSTLGS